MRPAIIALTAALLCSAATMEAAAQPGNGKRSNSSPPGTSNQSSTPSVGRGRQGSAPAVGQSGGTRAPWERSGVSRADWLLANRLASINHLRQVAQQSDNQRLLEQADKLEAIARRQFLIHACGPKDDPCNPPASP